MKLGKTLKNIAKKAVDPRDLIKKAVNNPLEIINPVNTLDAPNFRGFAKPKAQTPLEGYVSGKKSGRVSIQQLSDEFEKIAGRPPSSQELSAMVGNFTSTNKLEESTWKGVINAYAKPAAQNVKDINNIYEATYGRKPTPEESQKLLEQFGNVPGEAIKTEDVRNLLSSNLARETEATNKTEFDKLIADTKTANETALKQQQDLYTQEQARLDQENKLTGIAASLGGVSPSELELLRQSLNPPTSPTGGVGVLGAKTPEQVAQDILGKRAGDITARTGQYNDLRSSLSNQFASSRDTLAKQQEEALGKYGQTGQKVESDILTRLLPQIQSQLAARGLETGGGAFQAQTAQLAKDLATSTEQDVAGQRLGLDTQRAELGRSDAEYLAGLDQQKAALDQQQAEADKLMREGRLDQSTVDRLNQASQLYQEKLAQANSREGVATQFGQNLTLTGQNQAFQGLQAQYSRTQQQLAQDLASRQFEQQMAFQQQQYNNSRGGKQGSAVFPVLSNAISGAVQGGAVGGPWGALAGAGVGAAKGYVDYRAQNQQLRNTMQSPYTSVYR